MTGLFLKLKPRERLLINGATIENGHRKAYLRIETPNTSILRLRDALHPNNIECSISEIYHTAQLILSRDIDVASGKVLIIEQIDFEVYRTLSALKRNNLLSAKAMAQSGDIYACLKIVRSLLNLQDSRAE